MAIEVTERVRDRGFSWQGADRTATRGFDVTGLANDARESDAREELESREPTTEYNAVHPEDTSGKLVVRAQDPNLRSPGHWRFLVRYGQPKGGAYRDRNPEVLDRRARWKYDIGTKNVRVDRDAKNNPIVVSSGNAPNPAPQIIEGTFGITVRRFEPFFDATLASDMLSSVNTDDLIIDGAVIARKGIAILVQMAPTHFIEVGMPQVEVEYRWRIRPPLDSPPNDDVNPWWVSILDQDYEGRAYDGDGNGVEAQIFDPGEPPSPVSRPVRLNGLGVPMNNALQLGDGDGLERKPLSEPPAGAVKDLRGSGDVSATFLWYQGQKERPVSRLGLEGGGGGVFG